MTEPARNATLSAGGSPSRAASAVRDVRADRDVHPDEAGGRGEHGADQEAERRPPAELVVEAEQQERHDRDDRDRRVLLAQVGRGALLHGARDLLHPLVAGRLLEEPRGQPQPVQHRHACADEREEHGVIHEPVHVLRLSSRHKVERRVGSARAGLCITSDGARLSELRFVGALRVGELEVRDAPAEARHERRPSTPRLGSTGVERAGGVDREARPARGRAPRPSWRNRSSSRRERPRRGVRRRATSSSASRELLLLGRPLVSHRSISLAATCSA